MKFFKKKQKPVVVEPVQKEIFGWVTYLGHDWPIYKIWIEDGFNLKFDLPTWYTVTLAPARIDIYDINHHWVFSGWLNAEGVKTAFSTWTINYNLAFTPKISDRLLENTMGPADAD